MKARPRIGAAGGGPSAGARVARRVVLCMYWVLGALAHAGRWSRAEVGGDDELAGHEAGGDAFVIALRRCRSSGSAMTASCISGPKRARASARVLCRGEAEDLRLAAGQGLDLPGQAAGGHVLGLVVDELPDHRAEQDGEGETMMAMAIFMAWEWCGAWKVGRPAGVELDGTAGMSSTDLRMRPMTCISQRLQSNLRVSCSLPLISVIRVGLDALHLFRALIEAVAQAVW